MKKIGRSVLLKLIACVIAVAAGGGIAYLLVSGAPDAIWNYGFEPDYAYSHDASAKLHTAATTIPYALKHGEEDRQTYVAYLEQQGVEYYVERGDQVLTNTGISEESYYSNAKVAQGYVWDGAKTSFFLSPSQSTAAVSYSELDMREGKEPCKVYIRLSDQAYDQGKSKWLQGKAAMEQLLLAGGGLLLLLLAAGIYLVCAAGRKPEDEQIHMLELDRAFVEVPAVLFAAGCALAVIPAAVAISNGPGEPLVSLLYAILSVVSAIGTALALTMLLSMVRNMKNRTFLSRSLIKRGCAAVWRGVKWGWNGVVHLFPKLKRQLLTLSANRFSGWIALLVFWGYTGLIVILSGVFLFSIDENWILSFLLLAAAIGGMSYFLLRRLAGFEEVRKGISALRQGRMEYQIPPCPDGVTGKMAEELNAIREGMREGIEQGIRAERMKSELITNVSHDLKTPLTSIINYADLLGQEHLTPEEANDYVKIIQQKSRRLKNLTADLFDISKVQSGNEQIALERLDIGLLLKQAVGELDEGIRASGLEFRVTYPEKALFVLADGKKLSRVFENLIGNALKYSLSGTRVYIQAEEKEGTCVISFKNIASYAMEFDEGEITERFVRGDAARSTEGSGLGLAIAQSYIQACGGSFRVEVDGDLFKAVIVFAEV